MEATADDLEMLCLSQMLTLDNIQELMPRVPTNDLRSSFFHSACFNECISLEIVEYMLDMHPEGANILKHSSIPGESLPLALVCANIHCPQSVIELFARENPAALGQLCSIGRDDAWGEFLSELLMGRILFYDPEPEDEWFEGTPIQYYLSRKSNIEVEVVRMLATAFPESLQITPENESRPTPMHIALSNPNIQDLKTITNILAEADPSLIRMVDGYGRVPLDRLCNNRNIDESDALEVLELLMNAYPESVLHNDNYGYLPIHEAAQHQSPLFCKQLLDAHPESVRVASGFGRLPIHQACGWGCADVVDLLLELYPESIDMKDRQGYVPIHRAADTLNCHKVSIMKCLLDHDPQCASKATAEGTFPLHMACRVKHAMNIGAMKVLSDAYPEAIFAKDERGLTPLDIARSRDQLAVISNEWEGAIKYFEALLQFALATRDIVAMTTPDTNGLLPLHKGLHENNASLGAVKLAIYGFPAAIRVVDNKGMLPIHIACEFSTADVVQYLLQLSDSCSDLCDVNRNSCLHYACRAGKCDTVKVLLKTQLPMVSKRNGDDKLPVHLLCECSSETVDLESPEYVETIWLLLQASPETVLSL